MSSADHTPAPTTPTAPTLPAAGSAHAAPAQRLTEVDARALQEASFEAQAAHFVEVMRWRKDETLERWIAHLLEHLVPALNACRASVYWLNESEVTLHYLGGFGLEASDIRQHIPLGEGLIGQAAHQRQARYLQAQDRQGIAVHMGTVSLRLEGILYQPLLFHDRLCGVLEVGSQSALTADQLRLVERLAIDLGANLHALQKEQQLQATNQALSQQHHQLTDSLRYAERIQQAILPSPEWFQRLFSEFFLMFRPRDIVSGDFYWATHIPSTDTVCIAAVDCTGHGVPGAFMSMIGNTLLNQIVNEQAITDPAEVLRQLNNMVREQLSQDSGQNHDGMDLAFCTIHRSERTLIFAGAKRPLYYIREGHFGEQSGDRKHIGGFQRQRTKEFTNHVIDYQPGDRIYLTTDGLADQNDANRRRFSVGNLRRILQETIDQPLAHQHQALVDQLAQHQGDEPQRDDITVLGIGL